MKLSNLYNKFIYKYILILGIGFALLCSSFKSYANLPEVTPKIIEVIYPGGSVEKNRLLAFCYNHSTIIPTPIHGSSDNYASIYQWNNHFIIVGKSITELYPQLMAAFKDCKFKFYKKPFYNFNRSNCNYTGMKEPFYNIVLTANLVANTKLQNEYLNYHATQFEKWPEVAQGFCNAHFQHLFVFKNGRQLMLIISIPKGESLDKLNPLTTKNNPRVVEWNNIMKKYQEGIPGTKKGEVWVFPKPYNQTK